MPVGLPGSPPPARPPPAPPAPAPGGAPGAVAPPAPADPAAAGSAAPRPRPAPVPRWGGSGNVARSIPNSFAFTWTYSSNAAADSTPRPPVLPVGRAAIGTGEAPSARRPSTNSFGAAASAPIRTDDNFSARSK